MCNRLKVKYSDHFIDSEKKLRNYMEPHPRKGKHYQLYHKKIPGCRTFRGFVLIIGIGTLGGKLIFKTGQSGDNWFYWEDWDSEYIGDLQ